MTPKPEQSDREDFQQILFQLTLLVFFVLEQNQIYLVLESPFSQAGMVLRVKREESWRWSAQGWSWSHLMPPKPWGDTFAGSTFANTQQPQHCLKYRISPTFSGSHWPAKAQGQIGVASQTNLPHSTCTGHTGEGSVTL